MTKKTFCGNGRAASDLHRGQSKMSKGEATNHGVSSSCPQASKKTTWKRYLTFLSKFQNKVKHKTKPAGDAKAAAAAVLKQRNPKPKRYSRLLEECSNLVRVIRRTTVGCIEAVASAAAGDGEDELPSYVQLDQVNYGVKREAFGPIYLVT